MKIRNITLKNDLILAPLHGVNCNAFRLLCKKYGADLVYTSMVHDETIVREAYECDVVDEERPVAIQLVGKDHMAEAAIMIEDKADIIDINLGCPDNEVLAQKKGSFLIKHTEQMEKVVSKVVSAVNKPVTAKIRIGWDENSVNALEVCKILEDNNIDAIAIHGRTTKQGYTGKADWDIIRKAKEKADIPIIANGDVFSASDHRSIVEKTGCDAVMIGRGAIGNPHLFENCVGYRKGDKLIEKDIDLAYKMFLEFYSYYEKYSPRNIFSEVRQHAMWYVKNVKSATKIKNELSTARDIGRIKNIFKKYRN